MTFELVLSSSDATNIVSIGKKTAKELQTYQKNIIRFIYNCFAIRQTGAVLNVELDMNYEHACVLAIQAIYDSKNGKCPTIIMCNESQYLNWFYMLKKYSDVEVFKVTESNIDRLLNRYSACVLIVTEKEHKSLRNFVKDYNFLCLIIDQVDYFIEKLLTKQIKADFHIGITGNNFVTNRNQSLQWKIINWALKKTNDLFRNLSDFIKHDDLYFNARVDPYTDFWYTIRWDIFSSTDKQSNIEKNNTLKQQILEWATSNDFIPAAPSRKRKAPASKTRKKKSVEPTDQSFNYWSSDEDTLVDLSAFQVKFPKSLHASTSFNSTLNISNNSWSDTTSSNTGLNSTQLTLKRPKSYVSPNRSFINQSNNINSGGMVNCSKSVLPQHLRKTKSAIDYLFDDAIIKEFSDPFNFEPESDKKVGDKILKSQSHSVLQGQSKSKKRFDKSQIREELEDDALLKEFLHSGFESAVNENKEHPCVSQDGLRSLMTERIIFGEPVAEESHWLKIQNTQTERSPEILINKEPQGNNQTEYHCINDANEKNCMHGNQRSLNKLEENNTDLTVIDSCNMETSLELFERLSLCLSEPNNERIVVESLSEKSKEYTISSDDEIDNFLYQFIKKDSPTVNTMQNDDITINCKLNNANKWHLDTDSDSENLLKSYFTCQSQ